MTVENLLTSKNQNWRTPNALFKKMEEHYGVDFEFDLAASIENTKCFFGFTKEHSFFDNMKDIPDGIECFCNPPYGDPVVPVKVWVIACYHLMLERGIKTKMLLPTNKFEQDWFHRYVLAKELHYDFVKGRVAFLNEKNVPISGNTWGSVVIDFDISKVGTMPGSITYEPLKIFTTGG